MCAVCAFTIVHALLHGFANKVVRSVQAETSITMLHVKPVTHTYTPVPMLYTRADKHTAAWLAAAVAATVAALSRSRTVLS